MGSSESKEVESDNTGYINNNLISNNELKTTDDNADGLLLILVILETIQIILILVKLLIKFTKNQSRRDSILLRNVENK